MSEYLAIVDYGMGNLRSVEKALEKVGSRALICQGPEPFEEARGIILPGVGSFKDCMKGLEEKGFIQPLLDTIKAGKPYLGICLGLQVLFSYSLEGGFGQGLGLIPGPVKAFDKQKGLKVPHMGWNQVFFKGKKPCPLLRDIPEGSYFYFVHSYYGEPEEDERVVAGWTPYGLPFPSVLWKDNLFATQFHPEKSQSLGLLLLKNFCSLAFEKFSP